MTVLARAALRLAEAGCAVFPLRPRGKQPLGGRGVLDATRDPEQVRDWWRSTPDANIGIGCGLSGLLVVDLDGPDALTAWKALSAEHGAPTLTVKTARGWHLWYRGAGASTAGRLAPHVDTRGHGGYVLAPPSVHPSGTVYGWHEPVHPVADVPAWVLAALAPPRPAPRAAVRPQVTSGDVQRRLAGVLDRLLAARPGERNALLHWCSCRSAEMVADGQVSALDVVEVLVVAAGQVGLPEAEARRTVASGMRSLAVAA